MFAISQQIEATVLARPSERPDADVVIYDGQCRICTSQIRRLARWDRGGRLAFLPLADEEVARRWPALAHDALMQDMHVVDRQGRVHRGAAAFRYLSGRLPRLYWLAPMLHFPGSLPLWQFFYRQIARRRYRFGKVSCDDGTCHLHT